VTASLTVLLGGARAGKSTLALKLAEQSGQPVTFIATAQALDEEMALRIKKHQAERPASWTTVEVPDLLAAALRGCDPESFVIIDCLTLWVANRMFAGASADEIESEAQGLADLASSRPGGVVVVSNEVGLGIVPDNALSRDYRDILGRVNATVVAKADRSFLVVAGRALRLEPLDAL
jgi:adenosylcobinamide kinase / adenosylcobinamide-phosphate guanylyltransferase